ncbi:MAG: hypothetical protein KIS62_19755 [Ramlibacter sp.]|nr:hypothetical protein [Ramlibacter sp.]
MTAPDGRALVFAVQGNQAVTLSPGVVLPNGYVVRSMTEAAVIFDFPALNTTAKLDIPPAPSYEIR